MANFEIGISGLTAAQRALDVVGNNMANAATPGYHRQRLNLTPAYSSISGTTVIGGGVEAKNIVRMVDNLLEKELLRQNSLLAQVKQEYSTLQTVENAFGELATKGGLNSAIDNFFNSFTDLSGHVGEIVWEQQVVANAEFMTSQFRSLSEMLEKLDEQIVLEARNIVTQANVYINQIARLNDDIERMEVGGALANNLRDKRDHLITELSEYFSVNTVGRRYGVVDVEVGGIAVVIGTNATELEVGTMEDGNLGITIKGATNYSESVYGGYLGGLIALKNNLVGGIRDDLDELALSLIRQVNQYHTQGLGASGSFTRLDGWPVATETLSEWEPPITDGKIYIRVTDASTGEITREEIDLSDIVPSDPLVGLTLSDVADEIDDITGISCWVDSSGLHIEQETANYTFDFIPAVLPEPTASILTGTSDPDISISGIYTGTENDTFTFTVSGAGTVGEGSLQLIVTDSDDQPVKTFNIGSGYAAGDILELGNGINLTIGIGDFGVDDNFEVDAFSNTDTSGLLAAAGINTFFRGNSASNISVCSDITRNPARIASSLGPEMKDNLNILRLAQLSQQSISDLDDMTIGDYYRKLVSDLGRELSIRQTQQDNIEVIVQNLKNQRDEISGVDINEQAAQLVIFQQMFQSMAKYMSVVQSTIDSIMGVL